MIRKIRVVNLVMAGQLPFQKKLTRKDTKKLIEKLGWTVVNEKYGSLLLKRIKILEKEICVTLGMTGNIFINGLRTKKQGVKTYDLVLNDILKLAKNVLK